MKEISLNILDIIENSIKASARNIRLTVIDDDRNDELYIEVFDDGKGMEEDLKDKVFDPFITSSDNKKVGLGLPLFKYEAECCDGFVVIDSEKGKGTIVKIKFRKSHVDRPPFGDIISTILSVFITHPEVNFEYRHIFNGKEFLISTAELKEIIGDGISSPVIIKGIGDFIRNNLDSLYGGDVWTR